MEQCHEAALQDSNSPSLRFICLALSLFVAGIGANHSDDAFAPHDFAVLAEFLN